MANAQINSYKKEIRQANNSRKRQALFISEYIQVKYNQMYLEAAEFYNKINTFYPKKPDLRKTVEFRNWKRVETGMPTIRPSVPRDPTQRCIYQGITIHNKEKETIQEIMTCVPKKTLELRIPLMSPQSVNEITHVEEHEQVMDEGQQASHQDQERQQTSDEGQERIDEVDDIQPSVFDSLTDQTVNEIMTQLREDPELCTIMDNIDFDFDGLDIGTEMEIDDRLEKELEWIM